MKVCFIIRSVVLIYLFTSTLRRKVNSLRRGQGTWSGKERGNMEFSQLTVHACVRVSACLFVCVCCCVCVDTFECYISTEISENMTS